MLSTQESDRLQENPGRPATPGLATSKGKSVRKVVVDQIERLGVAVVLVSLIVCFSILRPDTFATALNFKSMIVSQGVIVLLALACAVPLRMGRFDFSVANIMILSGAIVGDLSVHGQPLAVALAVAVASGVACGLVNGVLVEIVGIDSFIATFGTNFVIVGIAYAITGGAVLTSYPENLTNGVNHELLGLPIYVWAGWVLAAVVWIIFEYTPYGRQLLFIGGNPAAAGLVGLRIVRTGMIAYAVSGLLASFAGVVLVGSLGSLDPSVGFAFLVPPIAALFLGASCIQVGRINVVGTMIAVYLLSVGITGLQLLGAVQWVNQVFQGAALIVAVGVSALVRKHRATA